jgi:DNA repair protein RadC
MGEGRIDRLHAAFELARRWCTETPLARPYIRSPIDIVMIYAPRLRELTVEEFHIAVLDTQHGLERDICVTRGTLNRTYVHSREVFRNAVEASAASVVLVHNHPSGNPTPSPEDRELTAHLVDAGRMLDIPVYDHVIIGRERYFSFLEENWL